jgi:hypothetical protein
VTVTIEDLAASPELAAVDPGLFPGVLLRELPRPQAVNDPALGFAGQRRINYAEAVWRIERLSELGQGILVPLPLEAELPEGEDRTPAERRE